MIIPEKLTSVERALVAASKMDAPDARRVLMLICESGMTMNKPVPQEPTEGEKHFAKREKFIQRMDSTCNRVIKYAKHETLRKIEKHFREADAISSAESGEGPTSKPPSLAVRLTFDRQLFASELLAALREDQESALGTAGQQLFDEIGKDAVWRLPSQDAIKFIDVRANLLANVPDEIHREIMQSIEDGLQHGESRRQLMARISTAFDEIGKSRAETIANTETAAAFNYSRDKAMREAGVTHKRWLHSMSPLIKEPRPTHLEADGQTQAIDDPFDVGGVLFMRPADDSLGAGPEDIINCHCVSIAVETPIESGEGEGHPFRGNQYEEGTTGIKPKTLSSLSKMDDHELRSWMDRVWEKVYPNQVSAYYDEWEKKLWENINHGLPKYAISPKEIEKEARILSEMKTLETRMRGITNSITRQPPYQAMKPLPSKIKSSGKTLLQLSREGLF